MGHGAKVARQASGANSPAPARHMARCALRDCNAGCVSRCALRFRMGSERSRQRRGVDAVRRRGSRFRIAMAWMPLLAVSQRDAQARAVKAAPARMRRPRWGFTPACSGADALTASGFRSGAAYAQAAYASAARTSSASMHVVRAADGGVSLGVGTSVGHHVVASPARALRPRLGAPAPGGGAEDADREATRTCGGI